MTSLAISPAGLLNRRAKLAAALLAAAALPVQLYSIPGFEFTPSLVLAPFCLLLLRPEERAHQAVLVFLAFCAALALFGLSSLTRNLMGAVSYGSPILYLLVGMTLVREVSDLSELWKFVLPAALGTAAIVALDYAINSGNLVVSGAFGEGAYAAEETTYLSSVAPLYGKFGVITFSTVSMAIGAFALASANSFRGWFRIVVLTACNLLILTAALMSSRQVMGGIMVFYVAWAAVALGWRRFAFVFAALILAGLALIAYAMYVSHGKAPDAAGIDYSTFDIIIYKIAKSVDELRFGQFDELTTGRVSLWLAGLSQFGPMIFAKGCGFCSLPEAFGFEFSTLHNVALTAVLKGGIVFALAYIGLAFFGIFHLASQPRSLDRDVTLAALISLAAQSLVNDVLFFQIIPQLLFALTGFLWARARFRHSSQSHPRG